MKVQMQLGLLILLMLCGAVAGNDLKFLRVAIQPKSHIDAIAYFGDGVVIARLRVPLIF